MLLSSRQLRAAVAAGAAAVMSSLGWFAFGATPATSARSKIDPQTMVYVCPDGGQFVVRIEGDVAWMFAPTGTVSLPRVRSASGARFEKDGSLYWSKGEEAILLVGGKSHRGCRNDPQLAVWEHAKLNGVDFRAIGNEPGWVLEISQRTKIRYIGDYGQQIIELESGPPVEGTSGREARYEASDEKHRLSVLIEGEKCSDTMSGQQFSARVTVTIDGHALHGCGRALH